MSTITLKNQEIEARDCALNQSDLIFYPENPRIFSIINGSSEEPTQDFIENRLKTYEHVKILVQSIKSNGGLIDPLIVRDGDFVVLEGNSRLAAYRILANTDPIRWGVVKCKVLPSDIKEDLIFALLGKYHIIGRKDWLPFEQAGYLWRRCKNYGIAPDEIGREMGLSVKTINKLVRVYQFMVDNNEKEPQKWSYYDEYLKPRKVQKKRTEYPELDKVIVNKIRSNEINKAVDIRDKVVKIISVGGKTLRKFIETKNSIDECFESAIARGATNKLLNNIEKFKLEIGDPDSKKEILEMSDTLKKKCKFTLNKINKSINSILSKL